MQNLLKHCYKYKDLLQKNDRREIKFFIREIENCYPRFSAAGFFSIKSKTFLNIIASVAVYFVAFLEFNKIYAKNK